MSSPVAVDIFVEDRAHEAFLVPMLQRIARDESIVVSSRVRSGVGGHGRAIAELKLYQRVVEKGAPDFAPPDLLIAGIDGNCSTFTKAKKAIEQATQPPFSHRLVVACPDPHVERGIWRIRHRSRTSSVTSQRLARRNASGTTTRMRSRTPFAKPGIPLRLGESSLRRNSSNAWTCIGQAGTSGR